MKPTGERRVKFKKHVAGRGGWSEWVYPTQKSYLFKCCDCGLVHEMQFKALAEKTSGLKQGKSKRFEVIELPEPIRTMFRARRLPKPLAKEETEEGCSPQQEKHLLRVIEVWRTRYNNLLTSVKRKETK